MSAQEVSQIVDIEIKATRSVDGKSYRACLGRPKKDNDNGNAIVVLHEIYGLNPETRRLVDWFVSKGFTALAPDLLWQYGENVVYPFDERESALKAAQGVGFDNVQKDIAAAYQALKELAPNAKRVAVVGYGWSCKPALIARDSIGKDVPYVMYYPGGLDGADDLLKGSVGLSQFHFAGHDARTPETLQKTITDIYAGQAGFELQLYPDAQHGFANSMRSEFSAEASAQAEENMLRWLQA